MEWTPSATQLTIFVTLFIVSLDIIRRFIRDHIEKKGCPFPPGPTSLPLLGDVLFLNTKEPHKTYTEWRAKYGDIIHTRRLGMDVVVLNSPLVASDLLEKRSQMYSNRPFIATIAPFGHEFNFGLRQYDDHWRLCRRIFHQTFRAETTPNFHPIQLRKASQMILSMMDNSNEYSSHYLTFSAGTVMCSVYDYDPSPHNDQFISTITEFIDASAAALLPERAVFFKLFPILLHIPDWLPGSWIKHKARLSRDLGAKTVEEPYQYAQKRAKSQGYVSYSMVSDHIARLERMENPKRSAYEKALKHASSTAFLGSIETTSNLLMSFTLAMVKNPCICKRAQEEVDSVVGINRLPCFDDRPSLPYVEAILRETMRSYPPVPLGGPHATIASDSYKGFYIPKNATIIANIWGMSRDETRYPNAEKFIPERFLNAEGTLIDDVPDFIFGFGRRLCPGRHLADSSAWCAIVMMLAIFDFRHAKDMNGNDIIFEATYFNRIIRHPLPFPCHITPRPHVTKIYLEQLLSKWQV